MTVSTSLLREMVPGDKIAIAKEDAGEARRIVRKLGIVIDLEDVPYSRIQDGDYYLHRVA